MDRFMGWAKAVILRAEFTKQTGLRSARREALKSAERAPMDERPGAGTPQWTGVTAARGGNHRRSNVSETNWTTSVIHIATDAGMIRIAAKVLGPIAVHFGVGSMAGRICITHVATGCRIGTADDAERARNMTEALAREDWACVTDRSIPEQLRLKVCSILWEDSKYRRRI